MNEEDIRTKQDLLFEVSSLNAQLSNEIIKNEQLQQERDKYKSVIDEIREYTNDKLFDDYTYYSYEDLKQNIEEILDKVGDVK